MKTQAWSITPAHIILMSIMMQNVLYRIQSALTQPSDPCLINTHQLWCILELYIKKKHKHDLRATAEQSVHRGHELCVMRTATNSSAVWNAVKADGTYIMLPWYDKGSGEHKGRRVGGAAKRLVTNHNFLWGRSCGVGMWSPVTRFLSATGSCLFILALVGSCQTQSTLALSVVFPRGSLSLWVSVGTCQHSSGSQSSPGNPVFHPCSPPACPSQDFLTTL